MIEERSVLDIGSRCGHKGCNGTVRSAREDEGYCCSCHLNPPCTFCVEPELYCDECDWTDEIPCDPRIPEPTPQKESNTKLVTKSLSLLADWNCEVLSADFATGKNVLIVPFST